MIGMAIIAFEICGYLPLMTIEMAFHGCRWFRAYSSIKTRKGLVETLPKEFSCDSASGFIELIL